MHARVALFAAAGLFASAAIPASAQTGYGQSGYSQGAYPDRGGAQRGSQEDGDDDQDRGPAPAGGGPAGGADYADADQAPRDLGRDLGLRSDQRPALQAYQQATTPGQAEQQRMQADVQRLASLTTPQRLDFTARQMQRDQADFARRAEAVRRFYAQLTPVQQRRFDRLTAPEQDGQGEDAASSAGAAQDAASSAGAAQNGYPQPR